MSERLRVRVVESQRERCPYCHDCVAEVELDGEASLVECDGCHTRHHLVCITELGRCTVIGCERPLVLSTSRRPTPERPESRIHRKVRLRIQSRTRAYVERNCRPPPFTSARLREELEQALEELRQAEVDEDAPLQVAALERVVRLEELSGGGEDRADLPAWIPLDEARARLVELTAEHRARVARVHEQYATLGRALALGLGTLLVLVAVVAVVAFVMNPP